MQHCSEAAGIFLYFVLVSAALYGQSLVSDPVNTLLSASLDDIGS